MDTLIKRLYDLYVEELLNLNIGYGFNKKRIETMNDIINVMYYLQYADLKDNDFLKIVEHYEG